MSESKITFWAVVLALLSALAAVAVEPSLGRISAVLGWSSAAIAWFIIMKEVKYE